MEETSNSTGTSEVMEPGDAWDAAFDGDETDGADTAGDEEPAGTGEASGSGDNEADAASPDAAEDAGQEPEEPRYTLKHLHQSREVGLGELIELGQKGLDYDRVREELIRFQDGQAAIESDHEDFLREMAENDGMEVEEFIDSVRANALSRRESMEQARAADRIKYERRIRELERQGAPAKKSERERQAEEKTRQGFVDFRRAYPEVKSEDIPNEVWNRVKDGMSLLDAYRLHEAEGLREELSRLREAEAKREQAEKNAARSMGSRKTSGKEAHTDLWEKYLS